MIIFLIFACSLLASCGVIPVDPTATPIPILPSFTPTISDTPTSAMTPAPDPTQTLDYPLKMLSLGDSYTIGESVLPFDRWSVQLAARLRENGIPMGDPLIVARTGWTTADLSAGIQATSLEPPYDLVTLLIGVNNQYRGGDVEAFRGEFTRLLEQAVQFAGEDPQKVLVLSIPDWGATPFGARRGPQEIAAEIDLFNQAVREEAQRLGVKYYDITPISRQAVNDPELVARDNLHPSGKMYAAWVELILPGLLEK